MCEEKKLPDNHSGNQDGNANTPIEKSIPIHENYSERGYQPIDQGNPTPPNSGSNVTKE